MKYPGYLANDPLTVPGSCYYHEPALFCEMLYRELLSKALIERRKDFADFAAIQTADIDAFLAELNALRDHPRKLEMIAAAAAPGAVPSAELAQNKGFAVAFGEYWSNHEEARDWAAEVLAKRTTFAADGSQLYVQKETSLPVGAVQVGWFENPHDPEKPYVKDVSFELLTPKALLEDQDEPLNPETRVGERRFHAEVERVAQFLDEKKDWKKRGERMPLAFFDGTLLVSFSLPQTSLQQSFLDAMRALVEKSRETGVPLVGFIDRSFAKDVVAMIGFLKPDIEETTLYDATLLSSETSNNSKILGNWGDRTIFCGAKRKGLEMFNDPATGTATVGFSYLQVTGDSVPARLDIPVWVFEEGLLDEVIDVVRAECVVGLGYPYALETADAAALISNRDREVFIAALRDFASREGLDFEVSRKSASKARRR